MFKNKTIKFFISSTFKDFEAERNILQKFVFPKLKELCNKNGFGFQPIDLRWGIQEEAGLDQQTMNICLNEIKRSSHEPKPNLLILVGQRYGWIPLPYEIKKDEFKIIINSNKILDEDKNLINSWYEEDKNSTENIYYLRNKHHLTREEWNEIEKQIRVSFQKVFDNPKDEDIYRKYNTSATEQEMYLGLHKFQKEVDNSHTFAYFRKIINYNNEDVTDYIDKDLIKLEELWEKLEFHSNIPKENQNIQRNVQWNEIKQSNSVSYNKLNLEKAPFYLKEFHDQILEKFTISIEKEINNFQEQTQLQIELEQQENFLKEKSEIVLGRDVEVERILNFIRNDDEQFYLQYGKSGSGKTSVMAKAISKINTKEYEVYYRFIGTTANSTYSRILFENIFWEIEANLQNKNDIPKPNIEIEEREFKKQFKLQLEKLNNKKVVIFLDALDQFEDYNDLTILLDNLPSNIKVVFSTLYDENKKDNSDYSEYFNRLSYLKNKYELLPLDISTNKEILEKLLESQNRKLTIKQWEQINSNLENITPLHLRLIFEIVKHWQSKQDNLLLEDSEEKLIVQFFEFIVKEYHHEKKLLELSLGYISASKDGLSEEELLDLLSNNQEFLKLFQNNRYPSLNRLPNAIWSRFYYYVQNIFTEKLIDGEILIKPYHRIIEEVIKNVYRGEKLLSSYNENLLELAIFKTGEFPKTRFLKLCIDSHIHNEYNHKYYNMIIQGIKIVNENEWIEKFFNWIGKKTDEYLFFGKLYEANMYGHIFYFVSEYKSLKEQHFLTFYFISALMLIKVYKKQNASEKSKNVYNKLSEVIKNIDFVEIYYNYFGFWISYQIITASLLNIETEKEQAIKCLIDTKNIIEKHPLSLQYQTSIDTININLQHYGYKISNVDIIKKRKEIFELSKNENDALDYFNSIFSEIYTEGLKKSSNIYLEELERLLSNYSLSQKSIWLMNYKKFKYLENLYKYKFQDMNINELLLAFEDLIDNMELDNDGILYEILKQYCNYSPKDSKESIIKTKKYFKILVSVSEKLKLNDSNQNTKIHIEALVNYILFLKEYNLISKEEKNYFLNLINYLYITNSDLLQEIINIYINFYLKKADIQEIETSNILNFVNILINDKNEKSLDNLESGISLINEISVKYFNEKLYKKAEEYFDRCLELREKNFFKFKFTNYKDYVISIKNLDLTIRLSKSEKLLANIHKKIYTLIIGVLLEKSIENDYKMNIYYFVFNELLINYYCNRGYANESIMILKKISLTLLKIKRINYFKLVSKDLEFIKNQIQDN